MKLMITLADDVNSNDIPPQELKEAVQIMMNKLQDPNFELEILLSNHETVPNAYMMRVNLSEIFMPDIKPS